MRSCCSEPVLAGRMDAIRIDLRPMTSSTRNRIR